MLSLEKRDRNLIKIGKRIRPRIKGRIIYIPPANKRIPLLTSPPSFSIILSIPHSYKIFLSEFIQRKTE